jgi:hypothetical protein
MTEFQRQVRLLPPSARHIPAASDPPVTPIDRIASIADLPCEVKTLMA